MELREALLRAGDGLFLLGLIIFYGGDKLVTYTSRFGVST